MVTTQFFGMKIRRYMHDHGIERQRSKVANKAFRNRGENENAGFGGALSETRSSTRRMVATR